MATVGLRELRQHASELVRRAEAGEEIIVTVSGRPSVRISPVGPQRWRRFDDISDLFKGRPDVDPGWNADRELLDQDVRDPWDDR